MPHPTAIRIAPQAVVEEFGHALRTLTPVVITVRRPNDTRFGIGVVG